MGDHMKTAIEQMQRKEEAGLNFLYSKTYNYVYLRAKSMLKKEADVQKLMKDVYCQAFASANDLKEEEVYEWIGKRTYALGTQCFRRKKAREAVAIELTRSDLVSGKNGKGDVAAEVISTCLEQLPELYQATFYAFYYDFMNVSDIAEIMDCNVGAILHRLNYTAKFIKEAFAMHNEESGKERISFSIETVCFALRKWSVEHCLGMASAQTLYGAICKELNLKAGSIYLEGKEFAGVNNTVVYHKIDDLSPILAEIELYSPKETADKRKIVFAAGVVALVVLLVVIISTVFGGNREKPEKEQEQQNQIEEQQPEEEPEQVPEEEEPEEEPEQIPEEEEPKEEPEKEPEEQPEEEPEQNPQDSGYILPNSDTVLLTEEDLQGMTKAELRLARNEIYARYGMIFGIADLDEYFAEKSWYVPKYNSSEFFDYVELNMTEEANTQLILSIEQSME